MDVERALMAVDVEQELRCVPDGGYRAVRMAPSQEREVGDGVELAQVWTGDHEEVAQHHVAVPIRGEIGEAVEQVEGAAAGARDDAMDLRRERLEAGRRVQAVGLHARVRRDQLVVALEVEVDELAALPKRFLAIGAHKGQVILDGADLPDDVVAGNQPSENAIERRQSGAGMGFSRRHWTLPPCLRVTR